MLSAKDARLTCIFVLFTGIFKLLTVCSCKFYENKKNHATSRSYTILGFIAGFSLDFISLVLEWRLTSLLLFKILKYPLTFLAIALIA